MRQRKSLVNSTYFYDNFLTKTKNLYFVASIFINLLFLKVKSEYKYLKTISDFINDFGGWKMKIILVISYKNFG